MVVALLQMGLNEAEVVREWSGCNSNGWCPHEKRTQRETEEKAGRAPPWRWRQRLECCGWEPVGIGDRAGRTFPELPQGTAARDTRWRTCGLHSLEGNISVILSLPVCGHLRW